MILPAHAEGKNATKKADAFEQVYHNSSYIVTSADTNSTFDMDPPLIPNLNTLKTYDSNMPAIINDNNLLLDNTYGLGDSASANINFFSHSLSQTPRKVDHH
ncbi:unnamed protein product [Rotaria sordida]|uniref:Uncharacterized protein n=2 Tax=Rotaria sordida TaxID=392033 RepID=A0A814HKB6_9BILA|nr:unnamed protein product [Rotaria sordida]CAF1003702.1 unnamed protein product [Rotaria sordida]CAF1011004.1 unnamed protein product [Rotaria sordida]CAF4136400.1 unnamed protein product [Rotaria sordida]